MSILPSPLFHILRRCHSREFLERAEESGAGGEASKFSNFIHRKILCDAVFKKGLCIFNAFGGPQFGEACFQKITEAVGDMVLRYL